MNRHSMKALSEYCGQKLISAHGFYYSESLLDESNPLLLELTFDSGKVGLRPHGTGEGLAIETEIPEPVSLGELGHVFRMDVSASRRLSIPIGEKLLGVATLTGTELGDELGLVAKFDLAQIYILNLGDEMFVGRELPRL